MTENLIEVSNLSKSYKNSDTNIHILKQTDFILKKGESVAVTGASGIGKSTLLHILGALDKPDQGTLLFNGKDIFSLNSAKLAEFRNQSVGFVFQFHHLLPEFSALENTMMPALINGINKAQAKQMAAGILSSVGLDHRLNHSTAKLSGGEQQRVALARALVLKPAILLADEPTGNLDQENSKHIHKLLMHLNSDLGMTIVVVTHNTELASYMSRSVTLINGQIKDTILQHTEQPQ